MSGGRTHKDGQAQERPHNGQLGHVQLLVHVGVQPLHSARQPVRSHA